MNDEVHKELAEQGSTKNHQNQGEDLGNLTSLAKESEPSNSHEGDREVMPSDKENHEVAPSDENNREVAPSDEETHEVMPSDAPCQGNFSPVFLQRRKKGKFRAVDVPTLWSADSYTFPAPVADTHAHLQMLQNPAARLARCALYGVKFVCAMTDPVEDPDRTYSQLATWQEQAKSLLCSVGLSTFTDRIPHVRIAIGCHPHNAKHFEGTVEESLIAYLHDPRTCALGEVGLDYHYDLSPREVQREVFRKQIRLAKEAGVPLILHMREAHDDGFTILQEEGFPEAGVLLHCFNLDAEAMKPWAEAGCYIAYGGPLTFKKADEVRQSAQLVACDHLLTETDSPYMTPEPMRGMECGPEHTIFTAAQMLEVRGAEDSLSQKALLNQLYQNALELLDRKPTVWQLSQ